MSVEFKSTLLREKFTLRDPSGDLSDTPPVVALSNRMVLPLTSAVGEQSETFIIRTQNMHSCVRLAAAISKEYFDRGAITKRVMPFRWENLWRDVIKGYEKDWNPDIWAAIYHKGRLVFEEGTRHPFLDIIEKCDAVSGVSYAESVAFAEQAFQQAGKAMKIEHDSNIALVISIKEDEAKGGVILRGANRKTTFNYTITPRKISAEPVRIPTVLTISAAFLEGVQLAFSVGMTNRKRASHLLEKYSDEDRKGKRGAERLANLTNAIETVERKYVCKYRPDRPDFQTMVREAEEFANKILRPQIEAKIASGELDARDWIT
jgi:hypothetical protein